MHETYEEEMIRVLENESSEKHIRKIEATIEQFNLPIDLWIIRNFD